ncbi:MAG: flagellar biosynthetic protein FliO [Velocimicrobium sp.]
MYIATGISRAESLLNLIGVFILFLLILVAAYFTSKWIGKANFLQQANKNIQVIETFRLNQSKYIQIVKIGEKYIALGISKDHMEMLAELSEDELNIAPFSPNNATANMDFKDVLAKIIKHKK